jgi:hypothetical protein
MVNFSWIEEMLKLNDGISDANKAMIRTELVKAKPFMIIGDDDPRAECLDNNFENFHWIVIPRTEFITFTNPPTVAMKFMENVPLPQGLNLGCGVIVLPDDYVETAEASA